MEHGLGSAQYTKTNEACKTKPTRKHGLMHLLYVRIDSSLTSRYPTSLKLETEPQSHYQLPVPQRITDAGRQGF